MTEIDNPKTYFRAVREAFDVLLWEKLLEIDPNLIFGDENADPASSSEDVDEERLPEPLRTWATLSDAKFAAMLWDQLGAVQSMLSTPIGRSRVVERMIQSAAIEQPDFVALLIEIKNNQPMLDLFGSYMAVMVDLAPQVMTH